MLTLRQPGTPFEYAVSVDLQGFAVQFPDQRMLGSLGTAQAGYG